MEDIGEVEALSGSQLTTKVVALTSLVLTPFVILIMIMFFVMIIYMITIQDMMIMITCH